MHIAQSVDLILRALLNFCEKLVEMLRLVCSLQTSLSIPLITNKVGVLLMSAKTPLIHQIYTRKIILHYLLRTVKSKELLFLQPAVVSACIKYMIMNIISHTCVLYYLYASYRGQVLDQSKQAVCWSTNRPYEVFSPVSAKGTEPPPKNLLERVNREHQQYRPF